MLLSHMPKNKGQLMRSSRRYGQNCMSVAQRLCESYCVVENEYHVLMECTMYIAGMGMFCLKKIPPPPPQEIF